MQLKHYTPLHFDLPWDTQAVDESSWAGQYRIYSEPQTGVGGPALNRWDLQDYGDNGSSIVHNDNGGDIKLSWKSI